MTWHKDQEVSQALIRLIDSLCTWERNTGRGSTLLLIPHAEDEEIVYAVDGKPVLIHTPFLWSLELDRIKAMVLNK